MWAFVMDENLGIIRSQQMLWPNSFSHQHKCSIIVAYAMLSFLYQVENIMGR